MKYPIRAFKQIAAPLSEYSLGVNIALISNVRTLRVFQKNQETVIDSSWLVVESDPGVLATFELYRVAKIGEFVSYWEFSHPADRSFKAIVFNI